MSHGPSGSVVALALFLTFFALSTFAASRMEPVNTYCDDAKSHTVDWDESKENYTCLLNYSYPVTDLISTEECFKSTWFKHTCLQYRILYTDTEPVFGLHRPFWAVFGEYKFIPPQRWLHNLEHGAIVMLYHPCANLEEVEKLRQIVTKCNSRHIITAHNHLPKERPLALLSYGCRKYLAKVDQSDVVKFIKKHAGTAPERQEMREGQYDHMLVKSALDLRKNFKHNSSQWCVAFE